MNFIGNAKAVKLLEKSIENGKISQAYLFSGPESVGKFTLAKLFASFLIFGKNNIDLDVPIGGGNKEFEGSSKFFDLIVIEPEVEEKKGIKKEKDIKIEKIREAQRDLVMFPYNKKKKVLIINNAHRLTVSAQNALLKSLEEPNETSVIILITHNDSVIIPTIKSRCQKINFFLSGIEEMEEILRDEKNKEIIEFSMGRPGLALRMKENKEEFNAKKKDFKELSEFSSLGINERFGLAEKMAANPAEIFKKLEFWMWIIRLESRKKGLSDGFFSFKTIEKIDKALKTIKNTNANVRLAIENLFLEM